MQALKQSEYRSDPGQYYGTPKELWGFRTPPSKDDPSKVARAFLAANAKHLGIETDLSGIRFQKTLTSLGARHVIFQQVFQGHRVHRAYVTVHLDNHGGVYLAKNRAVPKSMLPKQGLFGIGVDDAVKRARKGLPNEGRRVRLLGTEELWFPEQERLEPCVRVRLVRTAPQEEWIVYVHAQTGRIVSAYDNLSKANGRGMIFDPSPVTALGSHDRLLSAAGNQRKPPAEAYRIVTLRDLKTNGRLDGKRVTTNATRADRRVRRNDRQFLFQSRQKGFEEVMVYYHLDQAIGYLEELGYQGPRAIFTEPLRVNVNGTREDNSWYSPGSKQLTFGTGAIDDAEDAETILHEFGHALQDAIIPDFGQSEQAAAIGEGFGDYFAASFFAEKKPDSYQTSVMTWDGLLLGLEAELDPPCLRRVDQEWTLEDFIPGDSEHNNGEIWSATLWDIREAIGREDADKIIVESHFQLDGFTTFTRNARAVVDADENLNGGAHAAALQSVFSDRGIPLE